MVKLRKVKNADYEDEDSPYYIGLGFDYVYEIDYENQTIGKIYLSKHKNDSIYIEWVEINQDMQGKGILRKIVEALKTKFPNKEKIEAESCEEYLKCYEHIGFSNNSYDKGREMYQISLNMKDENKKERSNT